MFGMLVSNAEHFMSLPDSVLLRITVLILRQTGQALGGAIVVRDLQKGTEPVPRKCQLYHVLHILCPLKLTFLCSFVERDWTD